MRITRNGGVIVFSQQPYKMTSIYENTVCDVRRQNSRHPFIWTPGRLNARYRTKTHPFSYTDWEELLKRKWNKRARPLSRVEWKEKHAKNMNAEDCSEFLMGRRCGRRRRLLFRSGYYLTIQPDGSVKGTRQKDSPYGRLTQIISLKSSQSQIPTQTYYVSNVHVRTVILQLFKVKTLANNSSEQRT